MISILSSGAMATARWFRSHPNNQNHISQTLLPSPQLIGWNRLARSFELFKWDQAAITLRCHAVAPAHMYEFLLDVINKAISHSDMFTCLLS